MRKLLVINIGILLFLGCIREAKYLNVPPDELFDGPSLHGFADANVNYFIDQNRNRERLNTIALLPAGYYDKYEVFSSFSNDTNGMGKEIDSVIGICKILKSDFIISGNYDQNDYERWGGKACHDSICGRITKIVESELSLVETFNIISPKVAESKCDSIYQQLDEYSQFLWRPWFYPNKTSKEFYKDEKAVAQMSEDVLKCLSADAYVIVDVSFKKEGILSFKKDPKYEKVSRMFIKMAVFGYGFNVLWSAEYPISKLTKKDKYAYEIIEYNMVRENVARMLAFLKLRNPRRIFLENCF